MSKVHIHVRPSDRLADRNKCTMCGGIICSSLGPEGLQCTKDARHTDDHANEWQLGSKRWTNVFRHLS